jgi:hypothetical protein
METYGEMDDVSDLVLQLEANRLETLLQPKARHWVANHLQQLLGEFSDSDLVGVAACRGMSCGLG